MLDPKVKERIRSAYDRIARKTDGWRDRPMQRRMIAEVAKTLAGEYGEKFRILTVEGPTGTGKSLGYLLGAIPYAQSVEQTLVISTATVTLQEQLVNRDLPTLQQTSGLDFEYRIAKGRRRYVCDRNLARLAGENYDQGTLDLGIDDAFHSAAWERPPEPGEVEMVHAMWRAREDRRWDGDLDAWQGDAPLADLTRMLTADQHSCSGRACPFNSRCAFILARRGLQKADVIVANHALVMADLHLGGGAILPETERTIYVFDEAHHLPAVAVQGLSAQARLGSAVRWVGELPALLGRMVSTIQEKAPKKLDEVAYQGLPLMNQRLKELQALVERNWPGAERGPLDIWRFPNGVVPEEIRAIAADLALVAGQTHTVLSRLQEQLEKAVEKGKVSRPVGEKLFTRLGHSIGQVENFHRVWLLMKQQDEPEHPPTARWLQRVEDKPGHRDYVICASPVNAAGLLRDFLWNRCAGAVVTSATLTALGRFDRFRDQAGLPVAGGTQYLRLRSPFDFEKNGVLTIPWMEADPSDPQRHTEEVIRLLECCLDPREGSLVLFASGRQMREVAERLSPKLRAIVRMQGEGSRAELVNAHCKAIAQGYGSVLFGLASLAEGVDLPGDLCSHVVIAKLPFAVPDNPIDATYAEWLESRGRNPFLEISVPDASFRLIQAVGRLLRTEEDRGRVTILDRRIVTRRYGRQLLDALPPFRRVIEQGAQDALYRKAG